MYKRRKSKILAIQSQQFTTEDQNNGLNVMELKNEISAERRAQVECVLRILLTFVKKLKICLAVPQAIASLQELSNKDQQDTQQKSWLKMVQKYVESMDIQSKAIFHADELLKLLEYVDDNLEESSTCLNFTTLLSNEDESLLKSFTLLYNITEQRLPKSALSDLSKEKKLHKLNRNLVSLEKSIDEYTEKLRKQKIIRLWNLGYKAGLIHKYEEDLAFQKWDNNMRIKQEIVRSSKNIRSLQELSIGILKELEVEAAKKRTAYNKLLREDLMIEREARMEKKKLLFQLQTYIRKFDQNIGDRIKENLKLQEDYKERKNRFDEFLLEYKREEDEFKLLVRQKEMEDQLIFEQKLMVFMMSRAARVIQVYWRRFRRDQKKKSKRGKGKGKKK